MPTPESWFSRPDWITSNKVDPKLGVFLFFRLSKTSYKKYRVVGRGIIGDGDSVQ